MIGLLLALPFAPTAHAAPQLPAGGYAAFFPAFAGALANGSVDWESLAPWLNETLGVELASADAILGAMLAPTPTGGSREPQPDVETVAVVTFTSLVEAQLEGTIDVRHHEVDGVLLDAADVRRAYALAAAFGAADAFVRDLEAQVKSSFESALRDAFPNASAVTVTQSTVALDSLVTAQDLAPLQVTVKARITEPFPLPADVDDAAQVAATLFDAGATATTEVPFATKAGHKAQYTLRAPPRLVFESPTTGQLLEGGRTLVLKFDNAFGDQTSLDVVKVLLRDPLAPTPPEEAVTTRVEIRLGRPEAEGIRYLVRLDINLSAIDIGQRLPPGRIPSSLTIPTLAADDLRNLYLAGGLDERELARGERNATDALSAWLHESLGPTDVVTGALDRDDLENPTSARYDDGAPLRYRASATGIHPLGDDEARLLLVALDLGARVDLPVRLPAAATGTVSYVIHAPPGTRFVEGDALQSFVTFTATPASGSQDIVLGLRSATAEPPTEMKVSLDIVADAHDIKIDPRSGTPAALAIRMTAVGRVDTLAIPPGALARFDERVHLTHVSSAGVRRLLAEGILSEDELASAQTRLLEEAAKAVRSFATPMTVSGGIDPASLAPGATGPLIMNAQFELNRALIGNTPQTSAAITLYELGQTLRFPALPDIDATYTVYLPRGVALTQLSAGETPWEPTVSPDGRDGFILRPGQESSHVTMNLAVTPWFVLAQLGWAGLAMTLAAIGVALLVAVGVRRRRAAAADVSFTVES